MLSTRFTSMLYRLRKYLVEKTLPQYFFHENNLLDDKDDKAIDQAVSRIDRFMADPQRYLAVINEE